MPGIIKNRVLVFITVAILAAGLAAPAAAGVFDGITNIFSPKTKAAAKKAAESPEAQNASTGCLEGMLNAVASGIDKKQGCAQGIQRKFQEQEQKDQQKEQELLQQKTAESYNRRIDRVNERIIERQPRIERIVAEKKGDAPVRDEEDIVKDMDKKCRNDANCREAVIEAEMEQASPGVFKSVWYWMFPGSAPKAKKELKGIERDIAFLEKSMEQIKDTIDEAEEQFENATTTKQKSEYARDKGQLVSQYSQAMQALKTLKEQQDTLDSGYFAYVAMFFAAIGGTVMKKFSDHTVNLSLDSAKGIISRVRGRKKKGTKKGPEHSMY
jgi:hypothetical protein